MRKVFFAAIAISVIAFCATQAHAQTTIGFGDLGYEELITDQYASLGVIFDGAYQAGFAGWISGEEHPATYYNGVPAGPVTGYFVSLSDSSINGITDYLYMDTQYTDITAYLNIYDINGDLITSLSGQNMEYTGAGIHSFELYWTDGGSICGDESCDDVAGLDYMTFGEIIASGPGVVPEPATLSMLGMGLFGLFGIKRKRTI